MTYMIAHFEALGSNIDLMKSGNEYYIYLQTEGFEGASKHFKDRNEVMQLFNRMIGCLIK